MLVIYRLICFGKNLYYKVERRIKLNKVSNKRNSLLEAKDKDHIVMSSRSIAAKDAYLMDIKCEGLGLVVNGSKAVLNNVSASFKRGTLTAIMVCNNVVIEQFHLFHIRDLVVVASLHLSQHWQIWHSMANVLEKFL